MYPLPNDLFEQLVPMLGYFAAVLHSQYSVVDIPEQIFQMQRDLEHDNYFRSYLLQDCGRTHQIII